MITLRTTEEMTAWSDAEHSKGKRIGFVPTMGFLHSGHVSLMDRLRPQVDSLIVSIFVNPLQFGPNEDLDQYPRDLDGDAKKCAEAGVDCLFIPTAFYPQDFSTTVSVSELTEGLCAAKRPGHFDGVTTVVSRLFGVTRADIACFGEKDYQQLAVLRRMVRDLALPIKVIGSPLIRDTDGLALSSRNKYLSSEQRTRALSLHKMLFRLVELRQAGHTDVAELKEAGLKLLQADRVDYLEIVDADSLRPLGTIRGPARALVAGFFGTTRLIDNIAM